MAISTYMGSYVQKQPDDDTFFNLWDFTSVDSDPSRPDIVAVRLASKIPPKMSGNHLDYKVTLPVQLRCDRYLGVPVIFKT